jgi:hypothetical protein
VRRNLSLSGENDQREQTPVDPSLPRRIPLTDGSGYKEGAGSVALGVGPALTLQLVQLFVLAIFPLAVIYTGATQLAYIVPAVLIARRKRRPKLSLGLVIGAAAVFLLNAACLGYVMTIRIN